MITIRKLFFYFLIFISFSVLSDENKFIYDFIKKNYQHLQEAEFNVLKFEQRDNYFYFCGTASYKDSSFAHTDNLIQIYDIVISKTKDEQLHEIANFNSFSQSNNLKCHLSHGLSEFTPKNNGQKICITIEKDDPNRKIILDAIRDNPKDRFIVKRLCSSSQVAYFCGAVQGEDGYLHTTDEAIDVYDVILKKRDEKWEPIKYLGAFSMTLENISCHFGRDGVILEEDVLDKAIHNFIEYK